MLRLKNKYFYIIGITFLIYFSFCIFYFYDLNKDIETSTISYSLKDDSNYEVVYKDNNVFHGRSIGDNYIKKYIDKVKINFDYKINLRDIVNASTSYLVKETLVVYAPNNLGELWRSDSNYSLKEKSEEYQNIKLINNKSSIIVDYQKYLNMYERFKEDTNIFSNASIIVEFMNTSNISYDNNFIKDSSTITYNIPLTDSTINIFKKTPDLGIKTLKNVNNMNDTKKDKYMRLIFLYLILDLVLLIIIILKFVKDMHNTNDYSITLKKILRNYDSIIINIKEIPKLNDRKIVEVTDFRELVDVELELRTPINFIEKNVNAEAWFLIITSDIIWVYKLINNNIIVDNKENRKENKNTNKKEKVIKEEIVEDKKINNKTKKRNNKKKGDNKNEKK